MYFNYLILYFQTFSQDNKKCFLFFLHESKSSMGLWFRPWDEIAESPTIRFNFFLLKRKFLTICHFFVLTNFKLTRFSSLVSNKILLTQTESYAKCLVLLRSAQCAAGEDFLRKGQGQYNLWHSPFNALKFLTAWVV